MQLFEMISDGGKIPLADGAPGIFRKTGQTSPRGYAWRMLRRFKTIHGKRYQLHATRGWKCIGRAR